MASPETGGRDARKSRLRSTESAGNASDSRGASAGAVVSRQRLVRAGKLESRNMVEYETAARHALACGREDLIDCLLTMAEVEWEHEKYFRSCVLRHRWSKRFSIWPEPPHKEAIRKSFKLATE